MYRNRLVELRISELRIDKVGKGGQRYKLPVVNKC